MASKKTSKNEGLKGTVVKDDAVALKLTFEEAMGLLAGHANANVPKNNEDEPATVKSSNQSKVSTRKH